MLSILLLLCCCESLSIAGVVVDALDVAAGAYW